VAVAADAARDAAGNPSSAAASLSRTWNATGPSVRITSSSGAITNLAKIPVTVTFSSPVTGFAASSLIVDNATIDGFPTGTTGAVYSFFLVPKGTGPVTLDVPAGVAKDASSRPSTAAATFSVVADATAPTGALSSIANFITYDSTIPVVVLFSEPVTGFTASKIVTANGSVTNFRGSGDRYAFDLVPHDLGVVSATVPAGVVTDAAGNPNAALPAFSRNFRLLPAATITTTTALPTDATTLPIQIAFNQAMALDPSKILLKNATIVGGLGAVTSIDGAVYTFSVKPTPLPPDSHTGVIPPVPVDIEIQPFAAVSGVGQTHPDTRLSFSWGPAPTIASFTKTQQGSSPTYQIALTFDQNVNGLDASKFKVIGDSYAWISDVTGGSNKWNFYVTPRPKAGVFGSSSPNIAIDPGSITADGTGVLIGSGQSFQFTTTTLTGPTMVMTSPVPTTTTNAPIPVTVQFSEAVKGFTQSNLITGPGNGAVSDFKQPDPADASVYTFTLTPSAGGTSASVNASMGGVTSVKDGTPAMEAFSFTRTISNPAVTGVTSTAKDGTYGVGDAIPIVVSFSAPVKVVGTPLMALNSRGSTPAAFATFDHISSDGRSLTYIYTPKPGQTVDRLNVDSQVALTYRPGGANFFDAATNQPLATDALKVPSSGAGSLANRAIVIDTGKVTSVLSVSSTKANGLYGVGTTIPITVRFSRPVVVTGTPTLDLNIGPDPVVAKYMSGSGTDTLRFEFTVAGNQRSLHLDYDTAAALDPSGEKWTITDQAGNPISLMLPEPGAPGSLSFNKAIGVAGAGPRVLAITSDTKTTFNNTTFGIGKTLTLLVGFDAAVTVTGVPTLRLNSGGTAVYVAGTGTSMLKFNYTVAAGQQTPSLDVADTTALEGGTIRDFAGNDAIRTLPAPGAGGSLSNVSDNRNLRIAGVAPKVLAVFSPRNGLLTDGQPLEIEIKFDALLVAPTVEVPTLRLTNGGVATFIKMNDQDFGDTMKFLYAPTNSVVKTNVAAASAGQPVTSSVINVDSTAGFPSSGRINVPTTMGNPASVVIAYTGTTATSFTGCTLVFGASDGVIQTAGQVGNAPIDGRGLDAVAIDLNGAKLRDLGGNDAVLTLPAAGAAGSLSSSNAVIIKTNPYSAPLVVEVSSSIPFGTTLGAGAQVPITVTFSEPVTVAGIPELALSSGGTAKYTRGSGGRVLSFVYTVAAGQNAARLDYAATSSLKTPGGNIRSIFGTFPNADLTLPTPGKPGSLGFNERITIDTATQVAPQVVEVTTLNPSGIYAATQTVLVQVVFDRAVTVTKSTGGAFPKLAVRANAVVDAAYQSGSGTRILTFAYTIAAGQSAAALNYVTRRSLDLNGATIKDRINGKDAVLTLPVPGLARSLRADRLLVVQP
jgi:hypothetical protein